MKQLRCVADRVAFALVGCLAMLGTSARPGYARGNLHNVNHIIIVMQENHSFDNYFGVLPYVTGGPYHPGPCKSNDHACVNGLTCTPTDSSLSCANSNLDDDSSTVTSFHSMNYCPGPDLRHDWPASHQEVNFMSPAAALLASPMDGFVLVNDQAGVLVPDGTGQPDLNGESLTEDDTMGYYDQTDLSFYYGLAQTFAIDDRYFSSVVGPTFPNRSYELAATSFGHVTTAEIFPPLVPAPGGYKPITGTIMDLLDLNGVSWVNFFGDVPTTSIFRGLDLSHALPISPLLVPPFPTSFFSVISSPTCALPAVSFIDPWFGSDALGTNPTLIENDEHPPTDIRAGQSFVSQIVNAVRASACWQDSILFITYDEHGGFYDHVAPPKAKQSGLPNPDGINPGQCADLSNPPASEQPGGGANCSVSALFDVPSICPGFTKTGPYPAACANFNQLGIRVPFMAVSPFSIPHYVSHKVADHTSLLALIEKRFLSLDLNPENGRPHLTARDLHAYTLEDMFDFNKAPSLDASVPVAPLPSATDPGCPFTP